jgi:predicted MFS family arabinose efflux permease
MQAATTPGGVRIPLPLLVAVLVVAVWMTAGGMVIPFFNLYFQREHGLSIARIGALFAVAQAITAAVVFASGELASRIGPHRLLFAWTLVLAPVVWLLVPAETLTLAIALYLVQGFVPPATNPLIDQLLLERAPRGREGVVSSWRNAATELSGFAGASGGGFLLERGSFGALFATAGALAASGAAGLALVIRRLRRNGDAFGMRDQVPSAEAGDAMRSDTLPRTSS